MTTTICYRKNGQGRGGWTLSWGNDDDDVVFEDDTLREEYNTKEEVGMGLVNL